MVKVLVVLADGFEEVEALSPIDLLRRAGASVTIASLEKKEVVSSHNVHFVANFLLHEVIEESFDAIVLPGGMPGAKNLHECKELGNLIQNMEKENKIVAAICASPAVVLYPLGILDNKNWVCYPGCEENCSTDLYIKDTAVGTCKDGNIITSRGVGTAIDFGLEIIEALFGKETKKSVRDKVLA